MNDFARMGKQVARGLPYLKKDLARRASLSTGLALSTPSSYYVIFSGRCNIECTYCMIHRQKDPTLDGSTMLRLLDEAKALSGSGFNISLSGGEPTIYKPLYDTLAHAQQNGIDFGFTTNGLAFNKSNVQRILAFDPFNINVSIDSVDPAINESLRLKPGGTQRALDGIHTLLEEKARTGARVSVIVKPTIMEQNYKSLPDLVRHFGKDSPVQINLQPFVGPIQDPFWVQDLSRFKATLDELRSLKAEGYKLMGDDQQFEGFWDYMANPPSTGELRHLDLAGSKRNCDIGLRSMFIYPNGDVFFCDFLGKPIGNVHQDSLKDIYRGAIAEQQRAHMVHCNIDCQQTCKRPTPLWVKAATFLRMG